MGRQADLFAPQADLFDGGGIEQDEDDRLELLALAREEIATLLALARKAVRLPWADYTQAALAEIRFDGLTQHLPEGEGAAMRAAFAAELDRLYAIEDQAT